MQGGHCETCRHMNEWAQMWVVFRAETISLGPPSSALRSPRVLASVHLLCVPRRHHPYSPGIPLRLRKGGAKGESLRWRRVAAKQNWGMPPPLPPSLPSSSGAGASLLRCRCCSFLPLHFRCDARTPNYSLAPRALPPSTREIVGLFAAGSHTKKEQPYRDW